MLADVIPLLALAGHKMQDCLLIKKERGGASNQFLLIPSKIISICLVDEEGGNMGVGDEKDMLLGEGDVVRRGVGCSIKEPHESKKNDL